MPLASRSRPGVHTHSRLGAKVCVHMCVCRRWGWGMCACVHERKRGERPRLHDNSKWWVLRGGPVCWNSSGLFSFPSTVHVHAESFNCRANVNAHTHIMPAYVLSYQTHKSSLWTLPTISTPFTVLSVLLSCSSVCRQSSVKFVKYRWVDIQYSDTITRIIA